MRSNLLNNSPFRNGIGNHLYIKLLEVAQAADFVRARTTGTVMQGLDSQESSQKSLAIVGFATVALIVLLLAFPAISLVLVRTFHG